MEKILKEHSYPEAEKFIQEVFWRSYFKGWLEQRPEVWRRYVNNLDTHIQRLEQDENLSKPYFEAITGQTGIECFDHWSSELLCTGYLHNHARMWFASIWIFTLKLPWELGADFFFRHLLDGDAASNTCSWRWVAGLHTQGKTYLATADNISKFTRHRFNPVGQLATVAEPLQEPPLPQPSILSTPDQTITGKRIGLLITEEDCSPESLNLPDNIVSLFGTTSLAHRSSLTTGCNVTTFITNTIVNATHESASALSCKTHTSILKDWSAAIRDWVNSNQLDCIVTAYTPTGPTNDALDKLRTFLEIPLLEISREYDQLVWPHTNAGYFKLRKKIPELIAALNIT